MLLPSLMRSAVRFVLGHEGFPGRDALIRYAYRRSYAAYGRGDWEFNTLLLHPDDYVIRFWEAGRFMPDANEEYRGLEGYLEAALEWMSAWREPRLLYENHFEVESGLLVSMWRFEGVAQGSGIRLDQAGADVLRLRDGYVVSQTFYWDRAKALESVGLEPGRR
jgi:ketosteroid isomerase-like protein